jgi:DNA-binding NtrC family response regulator
MNKKIMVIEDEAIIALDFENSIKRCGYSSVGRFGNAKSALKKLEEEKPDAVLLDINLGGKLEGYELAEEFEKRKVPFIIITAYSDLSSIEKLSALKHSGFIQKPIHTERVEMLLQNIFQ